MRNWLEVHKIYFETVAAFLLSLMAITVSFGSYNLQKTQNEIAERNLLPKFLIESSLKRIGDNELAEEIAIRNKGEILNSLQIDTAVFYDTVITSNSWLFSTSTLFTTFLSKEYSIPAEGYYMKSERTQDGSLITSSTDTIVNSYNQLVEFTNFAKQKNSIGYFHIEKYIRIRYQDIFGSNHDEYYEIDGTSNISLMNVEIGRERFSIYDSSHDKLNFASITPNNLYDITYSKGIPKWATSTSEIN